MSLNISDDEWTRTWDRWSKGGWEQCLLSQKEQVAGVGKAAGVDQEWDYATKQWGEVADWISRELDLQMENTDWPRMTRDQQSRELERILKVARDSGEYWCDKSWGYEERPAKIEAEPGKEDAAFIAERLMEPLHRERLAFFGMMKDEYRKGQQTACKGAVSNTLVNFDLCMRSKVRELGLQEPTQ